MGTLCCCSFGVYILMMPGSRKFVLSAKGALTPPPFMLLNAAVSLHCWKDWKLELEGMIRWDLGISRLVFWFSCMVLFEFELE